MTARIDETETTVTIYPPETFDFSCHEPIMKSY